jgi:glycosyltransferase involved in cell wall biosynthesis
MSRALPAPGTTGEWERGGRLNILVLNLAMDAAHPVLAHTTVWVNELARRCQHVDVITMTAGELAVDDNVTVHSLGRELGRSEPRRLVEFYRAVHRVLGERRVDACFAHMAEVFAVLFAPLARRRRIPVLLWYTHRNVTPTLRLAYALSDRCVTASNASVTLTSDKLFVLGHGVDTERFVPPRSRGDGYERTALSIGRLSAIKQVDEMIEAVALLRSDHQIDLRLELVGGPLTGSDQEYVYRLRDSAASLGVSDLIEFAGVVRFQHVAARYQRGGLFLNLSDTGMDKALLEGMASGCIPVSRNPAFVELAHEHGLGSLVPGPGARNLARCIVGVLAMPDLERRALRARLRHIVEQEHNLSALSDQIISHLVELSRGRCPTPTDGMGGSRAPRSSL